jgi:hypothetical protein
VTDAALHRLHECLARELRRRGSLEQPVTVAEIYQDLVPYREVRAEIGVDMNADYEHVLLRLLSGESGLARLEPAEARAELRLELEMPDPNVTMYRKFAGCDVWVAPGSDANGGPLQPARRPSRYAPAVPARREGEAAPLGIPDWLAAIDRDTPRPAPPAPAVSAASPALPRAAPPAPRVPRPRPAPRPQTGRGGQAAPGRRACVGCAGELPDGRQVRFCPHCGADQERVPCVACGEELEASWRFCIACGAPAVT